MVKVKRHVAFKVLNTGEGTQGSGNDSCCSQTVVMVTMVIVHLQGQELGHAQLESILSRELEHIFTCKTLNSK